MDILIQDLQKTIEALETLGERHPAAGDAIDERLDPLFQHKIDLVNAALNTASQPYQQAVQAMRQAAAQAERAIREPAKIAEAVSAVDGAIAKLSKLLDNAVPIA